MYKNWLNWRYGVTNEPEGLFYPLRLEYERKDWGGPESAKG